ncbi:MAG: hypothetical protein NTW87_06500 [Planctomycetota bacterium]|nr:hypothetical protein [Planctomycetota bacterium]
MTRWIATVVLAVVALPVFAGTVEDAIALAKGGLSEEVMLAWAEKQPGVSLSAADILRLHEAKVPAKIIVALLRNAGNAAAGAARAEEAQPVRIAERAPAEAQPRRYVERAPAPADEAPAPVQREVIRYVERPTTTYAEPAVYYVDASPAYYSPSYYPSYGYGYSGYPYYGGGLNVGLSFGHYSRPYRYGGAGDCGGGGYYGGAGYYGGSGGQRYGGSYSGYSSFRPSRIGVSSGGGGGFSHGGFRGPTGGHGGRR